MMRAPLHRSWEKSRWDWAPAGLYSARCQADNKGGDQCL